jgi:CRISPR-associated protein Cmr1
LQEIDGYSDLVPRQKEDLKKAFNMMQLPATCEFPPYTAFSKCSSIWIYDTNKPINISIADFGYEFAQYRSYYDINREKPKFSKPKKNPNFPEDHDEMLKAALGTPPAHAPKRAIFGIPHNYFFKRSVYDKEIAAGTNEKLAKKLAKVEVSLPDEGRRSSPFFIHCHIFPNSIESVVIQLLLPSPFHNEKVVISSKRLKKPDPCALKLIIDWDVIRNFPNNLNNNSFVM